MSTPTLPEPAASFFAAVTGHDQQGFLDALTEDAVVDDWGAIYEGRATISAWSDKEFVGSQPTFTPERVAEQDGQIVVAGDWRSQHANGPSEFTLVLKGDRVSRLVIREG